MICSKLILQILLVGLLLTVTAGASIELIEDVSFTVRGLSGQISQIKFNDIDHDGFPEVLAADNSDIVLYSIRGDSVVFETALDSAYLAFPINHRIELADVNRDSVVDIMIGYYTYVPDLEGYQVKALLYDGASDFKLIDSVFASFTVLFMQGPAFLPGITALQALDIDDDGYNELLLSFDSTRFIYDGNMSSGSTHLYRSFPESLSWYRDFTIYDLKPFVSDDTANWYITTEYTFVEIGMPGVDFSITEIKPVLIKPDGAKRSIKLQDKSSRGTNGETKSLHHYRIGCFGELIDNTSLQDLLLTYHFRSEYTEYSPDTIIHHTNQYSEQSMYRFNSPTVAEEAWSDQHTYYRYLYHPGFPGYYFVISGSELTQRRGSDGSINQTLADLPAGLKDWVYPFDDSEPRLIVSDGNRITLYRLDIATGIDDGYGAALPKAFALGQAYPNPFNAQITIPVNMHRGGHLTVDVINLLGRKVATVHDGHVSVGQQEFHWDAAGFASGVYLFKATTETETATIKATMLK